MKQEELEPGISCAEHCRIVAGTGNISQVGCRVAEGESSVPSAARPGCRCLGESGGLGMQLKAGGKLHLKLNNGTRPIANMYHEGKVKSTLKRESKDRKKVRRETNAAEVALHQAKEEADRFTAASEPR